MRQNVLGNWRLSMAVSGMAWANVLAAQTTSSPATAPGAAGLDQGNALNEVVVTAIRRREESVQSVPIAISAVTAATLERSQINSVADMAAIAPNVSINRAASTANQADIFIRGFGNPSNDPAIDPPIALYVDGIYQPSSNGTNLNLWGLQGIEVDRGPQGTLLGKNAPTGAVLITSLRPTNQLEGAAEATYGRFADQQYKVRLNLPIIDDILAMNFSAIYLDGNNYIRDIHTGQTLGGQNAVALRTGILFTPNAQFEWLIQANGENTANPQGGIRDLSYLGRNGIFQGPSYSCTVFGHCTPTQYATTSAGYTRNNNSDDRQISSQATYHAGPLNVTSVTGYKTLNDTIRADDDGEPQPILVALEAPLDSHQFSQELRLSSEKGAGLDFNERLDWVAGGYFSDYKYTERQSLLIFDAPLKNYQEGITKSYAAFGHGIVTLTDAWNVSFGARRSWDDKSHQYVNTGETALFVDDPLKFNNFSFEAGSQYKFTPDKMVYFRFAEGYRAGGYQGLPAADTQITYKPEKVKTYEIGAKADFFEHHIRTNVSVFQSDYTQLQETVITALPPPAGLGQFIQNAANATVRGLELEATFVPIDPLKIATSLGYLDAKYKNFVAAILPGEVTNNDNFPFPYAPTWNIKVAPQYEIHLPGGYGALLGGDATFKTQYYSASVPFPASRVPSLTIVNASLRLEDPSKKYYMTLYGHNLTNRHYELFALTQPEPAGGTAIFFYGLDAEPITYGISLGAKF